MNASTKPKCFVGVDVSKDKLDVYQPDTRKLSTIDNSQDATEELRKQLKRKKLATMVVMEATGGYETLLCRQLHQHGIEAAVVNPKRVRDARQRHWGRCEDRRHRRGGHLQIGNRRHSKTNGNEVGPCPKT